MYEFVAEKVLCNKFKTCMALIRHFPIVVANINGPLLENIENMDVDELMSKLNRREMDGLEFAKASVHSNTVDTFYIIIL